MSRPRIAADPGRRRFLKGSGAAALAGWLPWAPVRANEDITLTAAPARVNLGEGDGTDVWAFNGSVPGPTLRVRQGARLRARFRNRLDAESSIHWHGIRIENAMDGVPDVTQPPVPPGGEFLYDFHVPDAGTFWYHSHRFSPEQVGRGLYGLLVVEEDVAYPVDRELTLVFDDWRLDESGAIAGDFGNLHDISHGGRLGNWITVNGESRPDIAVTPGERLRLRLANTANARIFTLRFADVSPWVIALDGQPVSPIVLDAGRVTLAPGQRVDLVVDVTLDAGARAAIDFVHDQGLFNVAALRSGPGSAPTAPREPPPPLPRNPLDEQLDLDGAVNVGLVMSGGAMGSMASARFKGRDVPIRELVREHGMAWSMNGIAGMPEAPLFSVERGRTVALEIVNDTRWPHAMHLHGHHFRVISYNGESLDDSPWRDTTLMYALDTSRIAFVADNPGKWLIHCHMLSHAAGGMMTWFEVT